ncbi:hypothetical protein ABZ671_00700 [Micromonospora sp. NPDC006766]|uniref:hypothetical protein n=1 Tax=Micromonospora sp. NPDC006766 TaxID=3154778 RepID=UPI003411D025
MSWEPKPLADLFAIPVHVDPTVPAGAAVFDLDGEDPRHITRIRVHHQDKAMGDWLTSEQVEQVRDHYRAMDERASRALVDYRRLVARFATDRKPSNRSAWRSA